VYNLDHTPATLWVQVEEKLYMGVREQKRLNTAALNYLLLICGSCVNTGTDGIPVSNSSTYSVVAFYGFHIVRYKVAKLSQ
jgi:hypothetical protein